MGVPDPRGTDLAVIAIALLDIVAFGRDQRAAPGEFPDILQESPLFVVPDRHGSGTAAFGPAGLELDVIVLDRLIG